MLLNSFTIGNIFRNMHTFSTNVTWASRNFPIKHDDINCGVSTTAKLPSLTILVYFFHHNNNVFSSVSKK